MLKTVYHSGQAVRLVYLVAIGRDIFFLEVRAGMIRLRLRLLKAFKHKVVVPSSQI